MKAYTDLEQSHKLAEILPVESADMCYLSEESLIPKVIYNGIAFFNSKEEKLTNVIHCWSLAALLGVLPADYIAHKHYFLEISKMGDNAKPYEVRYFRFREQSDDADFGRITHISFQSDNPIDACYKMIVKLNELKML